MIDCAIDPLSSRNLKRLVWRDDQTFDFRNIATGQLSARLP